MNFLSYLFHPNPGAAAYGSPAILALLILCGALVLGSFAIRIWRNRLRSPMAKKLSRSWGSALFWFGVVGLVLTVSRVEKIQFVATRFLWVIWAACLLLFLFFQWRIWTTRHYQILPRVGVADPRRKYLPKGK